MKDIISRKRNSRRGVKYQWKETEDSGKFPRRNRDEGITGACTQSSDAEGWHGKLLKKWSTSNHVGGASG